MIHTVNRLICRTCIDLSQFVCGCDTATVPLSDISIIVRRAGAGSLACENFFANVGCGDWMGPKKRFVRVQSPGIRYRAFNRDEAGLICFLWDAKFLEGEPGRWDGELYVCDKLVGVLKFQLGSRFQLGEVKCVEDTTCPTPSECPPAQCN